MAASAPPPKAAATWSDPPSGGENGNTLGLNMSHASIMASLQSNGSRPPTLSGSSVSTAPDEHHRHLSLGSFSLPSADQPAPSPPLQKQQLVLPHHNLPRPPGLGGTHMASPIGKSTPPINSISSSPNFNLSADVDDDFFLNQPSSSILASGIGQNENSPRTSSSWMEMANGLSLSRNSNDSPIMHGGGSYHSHENDPDDGLRGLGALRERSQSSPGPVGANGVFSSSPPVRIDVSPYQSELSPLHTGDGFDLSNSRHRGLPPDPRRIRTMNHGKERSSRPPLAGGSQSTYFTDGVDRLDDSNNRTNDLVTRMRATSIGDQIYDNRNAHSEQMRHQQQNSLQNIDHMHKFGNGHNLNAIHHNRAPNQLHMRNGSYGDGLPIIQSNLSRSISAGESISLGHTPTMLQRSISMTAQMQHSQMENSHFHRRAPDLNAHSYSTRHLHSNLQQRREEYDDVGHVGMGTTEEMRAFGIRGQDERHQRSNSFSRNIPRMPSSPGHQHVMSSGRRHSDFVTMNTSAYGIGTRYTDPRHSHFMMGGQNGVTHLDEDLSHPLAGELIDDPGDMQFAMNNQAQVMVSPHHYNLYGRTDMQRIPRPPVDQRMHNSFSHVESLHHHATAGASISSQRQVYNVKFKRTQRNFALSPRVSRDLKIGCYVKVEADRGEDLGIIIGKVPTDKYPSVRGNFGREMSVPGGSPPVGSSDLKRIVRLATPDEISLLAVKREEEEELLKICRGKVRQRGLPMHVVDAEYQFDRHKLTFFFEAEGRIDFRELVRDLFSMYKTRIWMQQLDKNTSTSTTAANNSGAFATSPGSIDFGNSAYMPSQSDELSESYDASNELGGTHHH
mmetsp:Transcript_18684/g.26850  ORF Transcript_18684/g.26850 Transcript_18684/m.26850 type:complete len:842 (+) Transcript_18684:58-2583(+)